MARQGTDRSAHAGRAHDLYETPPEATRALMRHAILPYIVWEPCAGRGAIIRELQAGGIAVIARDIERYPGAMSCIKRQDFFRTTEPPLSCYPEALGARPTIVTNPPFMHGDEFIRHGLALDCNVWVLMRLAYLEGDRKSDIIDGHLEQVLVGIERLPAMHRYGWNGRKIKKATMPFAWFHFVPKPRLAGSTFKMKRISWRD